MFESRLMYTLWNMDNNITRWIQTWIIRYDKCYNFFRYRFFEEKRMNRSHKIPSIISTIYSITKCWPFMYALTSIHLEVQSLVKKIQTIKFYIYNENYNQFKYVFNYNYVYHRQYIGLHGYDNIFDNGRHIHSSLLEKNGDKILKCKPYTWCLG